MWCLSRHLPLIIGSKIPFEYLHWECFLTFLTIVDNVFAPLCSPNNVSYIKELLKDHHQTFRCIYPDSSFIPKLHYNYYSCSRMDIKVYIIDHALIL